ncbi:hypothetical protein [Snodgrassella sp. CFCC 13594]|uniref:hypothetical protein n=1 Tax=Snodgrassella sp. CFCC 13594 TaxID=1775559 RepID=UPI0009EEEF4D|nr:hypothetical protein [Snodgrassella sp. CFCC 13594]
MDSYLLIPLLLVFLVVLIVVNKRQKAGGSKAAPAAQQSRSTVGKKSKKSKAVSLATEQPAIDADGVSQATASAEAPHESDDWNWQAPASEANTVSVETVDHLTEYKVYKQFGYFQKAADSLSIYLKGNAVGLSQGMRNTLVLELAELYLDAKNPDQLAEVVDHYRDELTPENHEDLIRRGLQLDNNNLPLRVLAEDLLGWGVHKAEQEVGLVDDVLSAEGEQAPNHPENKEIGSAFDETESRIPLVEGNVNFFQVHGDEQEVLLSFTKPEQSYQLLKGQLPYDAAVRCLNKAIKQVDKPASLIIDALALDYRHHNVSVFAQHLWRLYYSLGQYGQKVKDRMLGWGYNLGHHPMFDELASQPTEVQLREIGINQGFLQVGSSAMKAKRLPVVDAVGQENGEAKTPADLVLRDAEALLTYGQLDQAFDLLEESILKYPQESQLYITLFDLYERAEDWPRLQKMLQTIRAEIKTPPEEVVLAMSQLLQRINHNGVQNK